MPDFAVCNSTVCTVRKNCSRNWDSGLKSDRDPKVQEWVKFPQGRQPGPEPLSEVVTQHDDCPQYRAVTADYPPDYIPYSYWGTDTRYVGRFNRNRDGALVA
jgi:hypothetical protein